MKETTYVIVMITCSSRKEALKIKKVLLEERKVACINIIPKVESFFWWAPTPPPPSRLQRAPAKIDSAHEVLILAKTKAIMFKEIVTLVKKIHKYEVPEIIDLPIIGGNKEYLKWIGESLSYPEKKKRK
ncbi:MAG: divalent-cation tolerance protein CutA [Candidatus Omnitrophota bacterium]|nr:MAG: divalent-cation tolerance protein CutA [Candidatus Omnitrophota bacterium]